MTTKLKFLASLLLLVGGMALAAGARAETAPPDSTATAQAKVQQNDRLAWQRVGAPLSLES